MSAIETRPCVFCDKQLEPACYPDSKEPWKYRQPYEGGEIQLHFAYGSAKFDLWPYTTTFAGLICDDCAEKIVGKMELLTEDWLKNPELAREKSKEVYEKFLKRNTKE